jgi:hypothetical protein
MTYEQAIDIELDWEDDFYHLIGVAYKTGTPETYKDPAEWEYEIVWSEFDYQEKNGRYISIEDIPEELTDEILKNVEFRC